MFIYDLHEESIRIKKNRIESRLGHDKTTYQKKFEVLEK